MSHTTMIQKANAVTKNEIRGISSCDFQGQNAAVQTSLTVNLQFANRATGSSNDHREFQGPKSEGIDPSGNYPGQAEAKPMTKKKTSPKSPSPGSQGENYGTDKIRAIMAACKDNPTMKPNLSYIALISLAIRSSPKQKILLGDIYQWLMDTFPYYKSNARSWRNSIRHNLSLNECFVKAGRGDSGKGNYWAVHPANIKDFERGDFRRRQARRLVKHCNEGMEKHEALNQGTATLSYSQELGGRDTSFTTEPTPTAGVTDCHGYVQMQETSAPASVLIEMFGARNILTRQERQQLMMGNESGDKRNTDTNSSVMLESQYKQLVGSVGTMDTDQAAAHLGELSEAWVAVDGASSSGHDVTRNRSSGRFHNPYSASLSSEAPLGGEPVVASTALIGRGHGQHVGDVSIAHYSPALGMDTLAPHSPGSDLTLGQLLDGVRENLETASGMGLNCNIFQETLTSSVNHAFW